MTGLSLFILNIDRLIPFILVSLQIPLCLFRKSTGSMVLESFEPVTTTTLFRIGIAYGYASISIV